MSRKRMDFPMEVKQGSVAVKIYRVENKGRDSFTVSYHADGKRNLKMFASFDEALADAKAKANALARGELDALHLRAMDARAYVNAVAPLNPIGVPLELAIKDYVEAWKVLGGKASLLEAAKEFARRHMHELPDKMLPDAVDEMLKKLITLSSAMQERLRTVKGDRYAKKKHGAIRDEPEQDKDDEDSAPQEEYRHEQGSADD